MLRKMIVLFVALLLVPAIASAEIVYDGFDYPEGALGGNEGGTGWGAGAWSGGNSVEAPGLDYGSLPVVGNTAATGAGGGASFRMMPDGFEALESTVWISFLVQAEAEGANWSGISGFNGNESDECLFMGVPWQPDAPRYWGVDLYNQLGDPGVPDDTHLSDVSVLEKVFFVTKIVNGTASAQMTVWLSPDLGSEPIVGDAFMDLTVGRVQFDRMRINGDTGGVVLYDELRVGNSWREVIPEPATMALLGFGGLTLLRRRKK